MAAINGGHVLPLHRDYFCLRPPLDRRIYQIVRKHCGDQVSWEIGLPKLYAKSGSLTRVSQFRHQVKDFAARWGENRVREETDFLGYDAYQIDQDWVVLSVRQDRPVKDPEAAFRGFVRR